FFSLQCAHIVLIFDFLFLRSFAPFISPYSIGHFAAIYSPTSTTFSTFLAAPQRDSSQSAIDKMAEPRGSTHGHRADVSQPDPSSALKSAGADRRKGSNSPIPSIETGNDGYGGI